MSSAATDISFSIETVTPVMAAKMLESNPDNRKLSAINVREYARAMQRGEWMQNGEAIKFDSDDKLIDGQHRLHAIVKSGCTIETVIMRGLARATFKTIDTGKKRTGGDILSTRKVKNPNGVAAAARQVFFYESDNWSMGSGKWGRMTNVQLDDVLERHSELIPCAEEAMRAPLVTKMLPHSLNIFGYYMTWRTDPKKSRQFFLELASGRFGDESDAVYQLRERLIETNLEYVKPTTAVKLCWLITAWNAFNSGNDLPRLPRVYDSIPRFQPAPF